jgi:hypothetical protein
MGAMTLLAEVVEGAWRPGVGDPTPLGWLTVLAYGVAALACARAARREPLPDGRRRSRPARFWVALAVLLVLLGINKQLDLQTPLAMAARAAFRRAGRYRQRRPYQVAFIVGVWVACAALLGVFLRMSRGSLRRRWPALVGMVSVLGYVATRAALFHRVDALHAARIGGMRWSWALELGGVSLVAAAAFRAARGDRLTGTRRAATAAR